MTEDETLQLKSDIFIKGFENAVCQSDCRDTAFLELKWNYLDSLDKLKAKIYGPKQ